jgi:tRNA pseudouridine32 synthase/23S rRNA pseudouridine746 synthase
MPAGAGDCCAPKLLADAARQDLTPLAIAEIFVGDTTMKKEGEFYDACKDRCQPVLGFMLCGL